MLDGHIILNVFMGIFIYKFVFMIVDMVLRCAISALEKTIEEDELKMREIIRQKAQKAEPFTTCGVADIPASEPNLPPENKEAINECTKSS